MHTDKEIEDAEKRLKKRLEFGPPFEMHLHDFAFKVGGGSVNRWVCDCGEIRYQDPWPYGESS